MKGKIIIDTNVFLEFYRSNQSSLKKLEELLQYAEYLMIPQQVYYEYKRNRNQQFKSISNDFIQYKKKLNPHNSNFVDSIEEYKKLITQKKELQKTVDSLIKKIDDIKLNGDGDPINDVINKLYASEIVEKLEIDEEIIEKAKNRQLIGNPPGSKNEVTIGDEIIWESLLANISDDIVIVTNDKSFLNNVDFLSEEIKEKGYNLLDITTSITDAIRIVGAKPSKALEELETETKKAHGFSIYNRNIIQNDSVCGCFYCLKIFKTTEIFEWWDNESTAVCPYCGIDSVISESSGAPITEYFLNEMHKKYF